MSAWGSLVDPTTARTESAVLSWCKLCPAAIRRGEAMVWLTEPMGLSHEACARRRDAGGEVGRS